MKDSRGENTKFPPGENLSTLDALLTLDAAEWTKTFPEAIRLLAEAEAAPTDTTIEKIQGYLLREIPIQYPPPLRLHRTPKQHDS